MIHHLFGKLSLKRENFAVIDVNGVGYKVFLSSNSVSKIGSIGSDVKVFTHMHVREDAMQLFGFLDENELNLFENLISVSGIGPKSAMAVMAIASVDKIEAAIAGGEVELLQKVSGIGKKTAERIILDLKDKIKSTGGGETIKIMESDNDISEALTSMGYSSQQAKRAISKINPDTKGTSDRLKEALKIIKS